MNNINNDKILLTFAGNSDPTRGSYDGPIIHICRYHRPSKIYLMLTSEMQKKDEENIYQRAIKANLEGYDPEIIKINTSIIDAHLFDSYFDVINDTFERVEKENPGKEILVNITSGTAQMTTNLITYIIDSPYKVTPVQVSTPEKKANTERPVGNKYDVELEKETNIDNETPTNRLIIPNLTRYSKLFAINQIRPLIEKYQYETVIELLKRNVLNNNNILNNLLKIAKERKELNGEKTTKKINIINILSNDKYSDLYYYSKEIKNNKNVKIPLWYKVVDYFALAGIKYKSGDISGNILMMEPLTMNLYQSILEDVLDVQMGSVFKKENRSYKIDLRKLDEEKQKNIIDQLDGNIIKDDIYISTKVLAGIIIYFINKRKKDELLKDFEELNNILSNDIKDIRNYLAHNMEAVTETELKRNKINLNQVNSKIKKFIEKYYKDLGYRKEMLYIYDKINEYINEILNQEK